MVLQQPAHTRKRRTSLLPAAGARLWVDAHVLAARQPQGEDLRGLARVLLAESLQSSQLGEDLAARGGRRAQGAERLGFRSRNTGMVDSWGIMSEPCPQTRTRGLSENGGKGSCVREMSDLFHLWNCAGAVHELPALWVRKLVRCDEAEKRDCLPRASRHL